MLVICAHKLNELKNFTNLEKQVSDLLNFNYAIKELFGGQQNTATADIFR